MSIPALQGCTWQRTGTASCLCCLLIGTGISLITAAMIACGSANTQNHQVLATKKVQGHNIAPSLYPLESISHLCPCEAHKQGTRGHRWASKAASAADAATKILHDNLNST